MHIVVLVLCVLALLPVSAFADVYTWKDSSGKRHVANKMENVPQEYLDKVEIIRGEETDLFKKPASEEKSVTRDEPTYGGETFEWWKNKFKEKNEAVRKYKETLSLKRLYIDIYERGWMMRQLTLDVVRDGKLKVDVLRAKDKDLKTVLEGQLYSPEEVDLYNNFKKQVTTESDELKKLEEELWTLERDAKYYGVPYEAWR